MEAPVPSPQTTLLILLGASEWPLFSEFQSSEAFANARRGLKAYFLDPKRFGLPPENALDLFNSNNSPDELDAQIGQFLDQRLTALKAAGNTARDLLFYFVGHGGFVGRDSDFYLAIRRTRMENPRASGIQMMSLADTLTEKARHLRRIIILDCCFAAAAFSAFQAGPAQVAIEKTKDAFEVKQRGVGFPAKGTTLLCSSSHKSPSLLSPDGSSTMFTKAFLDALIEGMPPQRERLSLRDVKDVATNLLYEIRNAPRPVILSPDQSEGDVADIPFFPNPRAQEERARIAEEERRRQAEEERLRRVEEERARIAEEKQVRKAEEERARQAEEERRRQAEEVVPLRQTDVQARKIAEEERSHQASSPFTLLNQSGLAAPPTVSSASGASTVKPTLQQPGLVRSRFLHAAEIGLAMLVVAGFVFASLALFHRNPTSPIASSIVHGGTWVDDFYEEPDSLIPNASGLTFSDMIDQALYAPLFVGDSSGAIHPDLATDVPTVANGGISADATTWTFHLRQGLKWSDGQPLDARDVDFSWRLWTNPKFPAASTIGFNLITSADISPDNLTITFHLKQGFAPFLSIWVDGINAPLPAHHFQGIAPDKIPTSSDNLDPLVTSGPFKMSESKYGNHYTVVRNPNYYLASQGYPYLDSVVFRVVPSQDRILKDLQAGTIDSAWFLDVTKTNLYQRLSNYSLSANPYTANFQAMYFNFHNAILGSHPEVRKAMAMAVDHQVLISTARRGEAVPLCTDHGKAYVPGYQADAPCPKFDPAAANTVLDRNGWVRGADGVRTKNGMRLEFEYSTTANNPWRADDELILQLDFKAIGIKLDIQNYPASTFFGTFLTGGNASPPTGAVPGKYDIAEFEGSWTYDADDSSLFACNQIPPNGFNVTFYCNHQLDQQYIAEEATADPTARQQAFDQIHQIYLTDFPFVVLYSPTDIAMHKKSLHNYAPAPEGASETINIWQWWCDNGHC